MAKRRRRAPEESCASSLGWPPQKRPRLTLPTRHAGVGNPGDSGALKKRRDQVGGRHCYSPSARREGRADALRATPPTRTSGDWRVVEGSAAPRSDHRRPPRCPYDARTAYGGRRRKGNLALTARGARRASRSRSSAQHREGYCHREVARGDRMARALAKPATRQKESRSVRAASFRRSASAMKNVRASAAARINRS